MTKTLSEQAMEMYQRRAYKTLKLFKKAKKKSWAALGINPKMEATIMKGGDTLYGAKGTVSGRLPPKRHIDLDLQGTLIFESREIHRLKGQTSHGTMAIYASILEQEKFRADVRFPLFQIMQHVKRYKAIFAGKPYLPIFA